MSIGCSAIRALSATGSRSRRRSRTIRIQALRRAHGSFAAWLDAHHPRSTEEWTQLFRRTFRFTGGQIVNEFMMSIGYLPGAHAPECPAFSRILELSPPWARLTAGVRPS